MRFIFVAHQHRYVCPELFMPSFIFFEKPFPLDGGSGSVGSGATLLSSSCSLPGFQQLLEEPDGKPDSLPQPQTLNALSLPFFRPRFPVGCGGGGIMLYLFTRFLCEWDHHQSFLGRWKCAPNIW